MANDDSSGGIRKFCLTRWTVRGGAIKSILENYDVLNQPWEECLGERLEPDVKGGNNWCPDTDVTIQLCITDNLSKTLQKVTVCWRSTGSCKANQ